VHCQSRGAAQARNSGGDAKATRLCAAWPADGKIKNAILGENGLRIFGYDKQGELASPDRLVVTKVQYENAGTSPTNLRYGYISRFV